MFFVVNTYLYSRQTAFTANEQQKQKFGFRVAFQKGPNLKDILCKNKDRLIPNSYPGAYKLK